MARIVKCVFLTLLVFSLFGFLQFNMVSPATAAAGDPTVTLDDIADAITALPTVSGTASDDSSVDKVQVQIINNTNSTYWDGDSWEILGWTIETVDSGYSGYTSLAIDGDGNPAISYCISGDLKYTYWNGSAWSVVTVDSEVIEGARTSLAFDSNGNPAISYHERDRGPGHGIKFAMWNGSSWDVEAVDIVGTAGYMPGHTALAFENDVDPIIAYWGDDLDLYCARNDGSGWSIETIDSTGEYPSIAIDGNGNPAISYYYSSQGLRYALWNGSSWDIEYVDTGTRVGLNTSLEFDASGNPAISYRDATDLNNGDLKFAKWNGSSWDIEVVAEDTFHVSAGYNSLALDSSGNPAISYYHDDSDLKFARWNGSTWNLTIVDSEGFVGAFNSLAFDDDDNLAMSYSGSLKVARLDNTYNTWLDATGTTLWSYSMPTLTDGNYEVKAKSTDDASNASIIASDNFAFAIPQNPDKPNNISPADGAINISFIPTLESSDFSDPKTGDTHAASQWQISAASGQYSSPTWESGSDSTNLVSAAVPTGNLMASTPYYWRVRHQDNHGNWSDWSTETSFTTGAGGSGGGGGGGGGCCASAAAATTESIVSGWGIIGLLSATGAYAHKKRKKR